MNWGQIVLPWTIGNNLTAASGLPAYSRDPVQSADLSGKRVGWLGCPWILRFYGSAPAGMAWLGWAQLGWAGCSPGMLRSGGRTDLSCRTMPKLPGRRPQRAAPLEPSAQPEVPNSRHRQGTAAWDLGLPAPQLRFGRARAHRPALLTSQFC